MDDKKEDMQEDKKKKEEETQEPEKVKVGEKEYTQEELSNLVGLGEVAQEYETKWNRKISEFYPDYTQKSQKLAEFEKKQLEIDALRTEEEEKKLKEKAEKKEELTPEETKKLVLEEADKFGLIHSGNVYQFIANFLAARDLREDAEAIVALAEEEGKPKTTVNDLIAYMDETGIKTPGLAYKAKFEKELEEWKAKKVEEIKEEKMQTMDASTAGSKEYQEKKPQSFDELSQAMKSYLQNRAQG
ncbi:MAG: hypothetical protein ACOY0S_02410 [Patescibacteria group bacterium]